MCSSGQCLFLPGAELQQMDEVSTFAILIYVAAILVVNSQVGNIYFFASPNFTTSKIDLYKVQLHSVCKKDQLRSSLYFKFVELAKKTP
ncbi:hypothetical protein BAMA111019_07780 [Bacillus manliponensis]